MHRDHWCWFQMDISKEKCLWQCKFLVILRRIKPKHLHLSRRASEGQEGTSTTLGILGTRENGETAASSAADSDTVITKSNIILLHRSQHSR